jgi:hypothetical protein
VFARGIPLSPFVEIEERFLTPPASGGFGMTGFGQRVRGYGYLQSICKMSARRQFQKMEVRD